MAENVDHDMLLQQNMVMKQLYMPLILCLMLLSCRDVGPVDTHQESGKDGPPKAFVQWLAESSEHDEGFAAFSAYLEDEGIAKIVPHWQLLLTDSQFRSAKCPIATYMLPPRATWPNIAKTLRLVRDHVIPAVGQVRIVSGYRPPKFNACRNGASKSAHMGRGAFDMVSISDAKRNSLAGKRQLYSDLCEMWLGAKNSDMGLGAYYDPETPKRSKGRFHIDGAGYRNWGFNYRSASSPCMNGL